MTDSLRWPAEWELHAATWVAWPHNRETWPDNLEQATAEMARFVDVLQRHELVHVLAGGRGTMASAQARVGHLPNVQFWDIETNDAWIRDFGPTFVRRQPAGDVVLIDWQYNAWGGKYPPFDRDQAVSRQLAEQLSVPRISTQLVVEGGAIEGNGQGLVLTTTSCLLNPNRNPDWPRESVERSLRENLGADKVVWLEDAHLQGDDTDGHVDQLVRFVDPLGVVVASVDDPGDANYAPLRSLRQQLEARRLVVHRLPLPRPILRGGRRLPASYANFYLANGVAIVPQFDDPADAKALNILRGLLPGRRVIGLSARALVAGLGAFHCLTQQQPAQ